MYTNCSPRCCWWTSRKRGMKIESTNIIIIYEKFNKVWEGVILRVKNNFQGGKTLSLWVVFVVVSNKAFSVLLFCFGRKRERERQKPDRKRNIKSCGCRRDAQHHHSNVRRSRTYTGWRPRMRYDQHFVTVFDSVTVTINENGCFLMRWRRPRRGGLMALASFLFIIVRFRSFCKMPLPSVLNESGTVLFPLTPKRGRDGIVARPFDGHGSFVDLKRFLDRVTFASEEVSCEGVQNVHAVDEVPSAKWNVHWNDLIFVGLVDLKRRFKHV